MLGRTAVFIGLTTMYGTRIWVNAENIITVEGLANVSLVRLYQQATDLMVKETPEQIMDMIEEVASCCTTS